LLTRIEKTRSAGKYNVHKLRALTSATDRVFRRSTLMVFYWASARHDVT